MPVYKTEYSPFLNSISAGLPFLHSAGLTDTALFQLERKESMMQKTDAAILLIKNALKAGIKADYVLMDTWFTKEPMIKKIIETGIDAIGMVKHLKQCYTYKGKQYKLKFLLRLYLYEIAIRKVNVYIS